MATVEQRYQAATDYVRRAIRTVELGALHTWGSILPGIFATEAYAGQVKTESAKRELTQLEDRWMLANSDIIRARVARDAELLADRVEENLPGAPTDWKRTNLYPGEGERTTGAISYGDEARTQADDAWKWIWRKAGDAFGETKTIGKWLLIGGGIVLGIKGIEYLDERERRHERMARNISPRRALASSLERAASRNEYPISDAFPGSERHPLAVKEGLKGERSAARTTKVKRSTPFIAETAKKRPVATKPNSKAAPKKPSSTNSKKPPKVSS